MCIINYRIYYTCISKAMLYQQCVAKRLELASKKLIVVLCAILLLSGHKRESLLRRWTEHQVHASERAQSLTV